MDNDPSGVLSAEARLRGAGRHAARRGPRSGRGLFVIPVLLLSVGCGDQAAPREDRLSQLYPTSVERPIAPQERAAAAALAVYTSVEKAGQDPYQRALGCASSITATKSRLANSPLVGAGELQALTQAEQLFEARAMRLASDNGRSRAAASAELGRARIEAEQDQSGAGQTAIACIRTLADETREALPPRG